MGRKKPRLKLVGVSTSLRGAKAFIVPASARKSKFDYSNMPYTRWVEQNGASLAKNPKEADFLVFTGGQDISTSLYHQTPHNSTQAPSVIRDRREIAMFYNNPDKLKVGICRGAQLLNVLSGGSLVQHIHGSAHLRNHSVFDVRNQRVIKEVASTHHQMMLPSPDITRRNILLLAYNERHAKDSVRSDYTMCDNWQQKEGTPGFRQGTQGYERMQRFLNAYKAKDFDPFNEDLEVVYYNNTKSLCIQSHPENNRSKEIFNKWCINEIDKRLGQISKETKG